MPTTSQYADILTKGLPSTVFAEFRSSLNVHDAADQTAGRVLEDYVGIFLFLYFLKMFFYINIFLVS